MDKFVEVVSSGELETLVELYAKYYPNHPIAYSTLKNYAEWQRKNVDFRYVKIFRLKNDVTNSGLFMIMDRYHIMVHSRIPNDEHLKEILRLQDWTYGYKIAAIAEDQVSTIKDFVNELGITVRLYPLRLFCLKKEKAEQIEISCPEGYELGALSEEHLKFVHDRWPPRQKASIHFLRCLIKYNTTVALFRKDTKELVGWCIRCHCGFLGFLFVLEEYRRKGLAELIIKKYARILAEKEEDCYTSIFHLNESSLRFFRKLGFQQGPDCFHIRAYKVNEDDVWPFEN